MFPCDVNSARQTLKRKKNFKINPNKIQNIQLLSVAVEKFSVTVQQLKLDTSAGVYILASFFIPVLVWRAKGIWITEAHSSKTQIFLSSVWEGENKGKQREGTGRKGLSNMHLGKNLPVCFCREKQTKQNKKSKPRIQSMWVTNPSEGLSPSKTVARKGKGSLLPYNLNWLTRTAIKISAEKGRSSEIPRAGIKPWNTADVHSNTSTGTQSLLPVMLSPRSLEWFRNFKQ